MFLIRTSSFLVKDELLEGDEEDYREEQVEERDREEDERGHRASETIPCTKRPCLGPGN